MYKLKYCLLLMMFCSNICLADTLSCGIEKPNTSGEFLGIESNGIARFQTEDHKIILFGFQQCTVTLEK